jgi:excisionase family DNA binding protein
MNETATLLTVEQAAQRLRIGRSKAYALAASGRLPGAIRLGASIRVSSEALEQWIVRNASDPRPAA